MTEYHRKNLAAFTATISPYTSLWRSLIIRVGWTSVGDFSMVVYLNATLEATAPDDVETPKYSPTVGAFQATWEVRPAEALPQFVAELGNGEINICGQSLRLGKYQNRSWQNGGFGWQAFESRGRSSYTPDGSPVCYLQESGSRLEDDTNGALTNQGLRAEWLNLPHPYKNHTEVLEDYFKLKSVQTEGTFLTVQAIFPIFFTKTRDDRSFTVTAPITVDKAKVTVGQIVTLIDGKTNRGEMSGSSQEWRPSVNGLQLSIAPLQSNQPIEKAFAVLRYGSLLLDEHSLTRPDSTPSPDAIGQISSESAPVILSSDVPLKNPKDDKFGFAPFAKHLADCIINAGPTEGLVIGLYGPWGAGKSTMVNFLLANVASCPESKRPVVVHFNPWIFSGHEDLSRSFFSQLLGTLSKWDEIGTEIRNSLADFSEGISDAPIPGAGVGKYIAKLLRRQPPSLSDLKDRVEAALRQSPRRILIIIDDLDRLVADEIRQVFRLVKAVANFPNVTYLMCFDKTVAIKAIHDLQHTSGEEYLGKIIQVPFELPMPDRVNLRKLLFERLNEILGGTPPDLFDSTYWANVYIEGIDHFIRTPRDVARLTNTLRVTYASIRGEVNASDFIAIDTLRVFCPFVYELIRSNPDNFTGHIEHGASEELKRFHEAWLSQVEVANRESVRRLAVRIFPKLESVWGNTSYGASWLAGWRKALRVCSPETFPVYFRLVVPDGSTSMADIRLLTAMMSDPASFSSRLLSYGEERTADGSTKLRSLLERLTDYAEVGVTREMAEAGIKGFFQVGDRLIAIHEPRRGMFDYDNSTRIGRVIWRLLKCIDKAERATVLSDAMRLGSSITLAVREVSVLGQQHGKYSGDKDSESDQLISASDLAVLESLVREMIDVAAMGKKVVYLPELPTVLHRWADWGSEENVRRYIANVIQDDQTLATFVAAFGQSTFSQSITDKVAKTKFRLNPKWLKRFVDPATIQPRIKALVDNPALSETQAEALQQFLREQALLDAGKNPDSWRE